MLVELDEFERNILERLRQKTAKSDSEIVKLAIYELERALMDRDAFSVQNPFIYPNTFPYYPCTGNDFIITCGKSDFETTTGAITIAGDKVA